MRYNQLKYISQNEGFTIIIKPKDSLFLQDDYLIPQIRLKLEMLTSVPNFFCMGENGATEPYLSITQARLFLKRIKLTQIAEKSLYQKLAIPGNPAKYIFPRMRYTNQIIGKVPSKRIVSLLSGTRPNKVIVFFTKQLASEPATGSFDNNATAFTEFDNATNYVKAIYINVAGRQFPTKELDFEAKNDVHRAYEMYKMSCADPKKPALNLDQFSENHRIFCFNTSKT